MGPRVRGRVAVEPITVSSEARPGTLQIARCCARPRGCGARANSVGGAAPTRAPCDRQVRKLRLFPGVDLETLQPAHGHPTAQPAQYRLELDGAAHRG